MARSDSSPDSLSKGVSHAAVGIFAAAVASYVMVGILGLRKNSGTYAVLAAAGAMWMHAEYDLPLAKALGRLGL